jgi:hypothetical protein
LKSNLSDVLVVDPKNFLGTFFFEFVVGRDLDGLALDQAHLFAAVVPLEKTGTNL